MIQYTKPLTHLREYRKVTTVERIKSWNQYCSHSFGYDIVSEGGKAVWKFKLSGYGEHGPCALLGIVAMIWPLLSWLSRGGEGSAYRAVSEWGSATVCGLGTYWFFLRALG